MSLGFLEIRRLAEQLLEMRLNGKHILAFCMHIWDIVLALFIFIKHHKMIRARSAKMRALLEKLALCKFRPKTFLACSQLRPTFGEVTSVPFFARVVFNV